MDITQNLTIDGSTYAANGDGEITARKAELSFDSFVQRWQAASLTPIYGIYQ